ncbi:NIL domain-containing protein [Rossellomorea vietnamensis]|uniref:methionine ABC transporter ATP-binding protein n=1 Tax=Rossellomorea vietnamensis TaxID=218284 RepID=UPI00077C4F28
MIRVQNVMKVFETKDGPFPALKDVSFEVKHYPDELSGGQKQRVGIARALATSPSILLCDEATSALDPQTTESILNLLKRINAEYGITIVMITHEMGVIREICDKVAVMENGEIVEEGTVFDIFSNPQTSTTRNFVKSVMNDQLPASVLDKLNDSKEGRICRLIFKGDSTGTPILSETAKKFDAHINVLFGQITELQGKPFGNLIVQIIGSKKDTEEILEYWKNRLFVSEEEKRAS